MATEERLLQIILWTFLASLTHRSTPTGCSCGVMDNMRSEINRIMKVQMCHFSVLRVYNAFSPPAQCVVTIAQCDVVIASLWRKPSWSL